MPDWIPVALGDDIPLSTVIPFSYDGQDHALWRSASGKLAAVPDRCPHRGMRLSHGFVRGERLNCIYHGWAFDNEGQCRRIPAHPDLVPPQAIRVQVLSIVERGGVVWVSPDAGGLTPDLGGLTPLRQIEVAMPADRLPDSVPKGVVRLLSSRSGPDSCIVIALVAAGATVAQRLAASTALEQWRHEVEHG